MHFTLVYEALLRIKSLGVFHFETTRKTEPPKIGVSFHLTFWVSTVSLISKLLTLVADLRDFEKKCIVERRGEKS